MFEISGNDITDLSDSDLRSLVAQLAVAELGVRGCPRSSVTAGGSQDAADGGLDVRVECPTDFDAPDFVPRRLTGFQVKKPDMPSSAIRDEMRPKGALREVIRELADASGAYVMISAQGSVADKPLADRRKAIRDALHDLPSAAQLHTDFYDRDRLATWVNEYPGISAWVRGRIGRALSGWSSIGDWESGRVRASNPYLFNDKACLIDGRSRDREHLAIEEGIARLRAGLRRPKQCIRLVGLSGLGKTRLVQALFEDGVGEDPLDPSIAVYTDYSEETDPTARNMARQLIANRQRAILIVDNCNPATHSELARLCTNEDSKVSLITVEYDVGDEEPEHTEVFRLQAASAELVNEWIKQSFIDISEVDRDKIAEFSDGNFRVARALAETLGRGETLGSLKSRDLFERIFRQRNQPDQQLLQAAEDLSLLYSVNGEDVSEDNELGRIGAIRGTSIRALYEALAEMRKRGVVQARGSFRAVLPQAIANPLAAHALDRIPPTFFDQFCRTLTPRMLKSVSRRLGFLHDSAAAQATVARWLRADGPLGDLMAVGKDGFQIIANIAPVTPEAVLARFEGEIDKLTGDRWVGLTKSIGYDPSLFDRAATLLARFASSEPESNNLNSVRNNFSELFHIYLSGTKTTPEQRRSLIKRFAASSEKKLRSTVPMALQALLKADAFMSSARHDFGARSRDWGWHPKTHQDIWDWYQEAIPLAIELLPDADARTLLAKNARSLWCHPPCQSALERAATAFSERRPWIEGWIALRAALRFDGKNMPGDVRTKLEQLTERLKPLDLLNRARAIVFNRMNNGWDFADGEESDDDDVTKGWERANKAAQEIGRALVHEPSIRAEFLAELLLEPHAQRAFELGRGLAEDVDDLNTMWHELVTVYEVAESNSRNPIVLCGFLCEAQTRDQDFTSLALDAVIDNHNLAPALPRFQGCIGIDIAGIARLRKAVAKNVLVAGNFYCIANGSVSESPPEPLAALLEDIATLSGGVEMALDLLHMRLYRHKNDVRAVHPRLISVGQTLLTHATFKRDSPLRDFAVHEVILVCFAGDSGRTDAERLCTHVRSALESHQTSSYDLSYTLKALFKSQPFAALDTFLPPAPSDFGAWMFEGHTHMGNPINDVDPAVLHEWASRDSATRYPLLGASLGMFGKKKGEDETDFSPIFLSLLSKAPDKWLFLGDLWHRLHPRSWSGSLADILISRKTQLATLAKHPDEQVRAWIEDALPKLDCWIEHERGRDRVSEESFE